jgi:hypothetical protein
MSVNDYDEDLLLAISDAVDEGHLEEKTPAHGIALQVVHQGYKSLSPKQRYVYDTEVVPALAAVAKDNEAIQMRNRLLKED